jgi:hypothetical protein
VTFLAPLAAVLAITVPAIVALYFLRIRRPTRIVPALHLWPNQILDRQANVPWQKLRASWLLLLQLLIAAFLVVAAVKPAVSASVSLSPHSIVLLDTSASMQAHDVQPTRLEEAKRQIGALIDQLGPQDRMTLITVQSSPRIAASVTGDHDALHRALAQVTASNGTADLSAALTLASGALHGGEDAHAYLYGDGIMQPLRAAFGDGVPFPIDYHRIGASGENVGLTSLVVRTNAQSRAAYLRVQNFGQQSRSFSLEWRSDAGLIDVRPLTLSGGQAQDLVLPVPAAATTVTAHIDTNDVFALDDTVTAIARTPQAFRVLLVTEGNVFLEQALRLRSDFQLDIAAPNSYVGASGYAMTIFDRFSPRALPDAPFIMVDPPAGSPLAGGNAVGIGRVRANDAGDPLLTNVSLQDVHIARSQDLTSTTFGRALITSVQTPLVLVREQPFRQALFGFDVHDSDFPLRIGFPILVQNLSEWMLPPSVPSRSFHPDEAVTIVPKTGATSVAVVRPDGSRRAFATGSIATFADTGLIGVYTVEQVVAGKVDRSWFAVNLFSETTSQLKPIDRLTLPPSRSAAAGHVSHRGFIEFWPWIVLAALGLVVVEWLAFHRGL